MKKEINMNTKRLMNVFSKGFSVKEDVALSALTEQFINQYYYYLVKFIELSNNKTLGSVEEFQLDKYTEITKKYLDWFEQKGSKSLELTIKLLLIDFYKCKIQP